MALWARSAHAHGAEMMLGSTASQSGALALSYEFADKVVVTPDVSLGGTTLSSSLFPGIEWLQADQAPLYALQVGTPFSLQIVSIDPGAEVMVGATTLKAAGQSAFVATTTTVPGDHFHPQWELLLPDGVEGDYAVSFKLTTTSPLYTASAVYALVITNLPQPTDTPTATPKDVSTVTPSPSPIPTTAASETPSASPTAAPTDTSTPVATASTTATAPPPSTSTPTFRALCPGDCNGDGTVTVAELVVGVAIALDERSVDVCPPADGDHDGVVEIAELVRAIGAILDGCGGAPDAYDE